MKKKKEMSTLAAAISGAGTVDLKSLIHEHSLFFDGLIELIPARFYLPTDDDAKPWFQGLSKVAKAAAKKQTRENLKQARRLRLDPEKPQSSTLALLEQSVEVKKQPKIEGKDEDNGEKKMEPVAEGGRSVTYEELRLRLRQRIELLRGNRGESSKSEKRDNHQRKRKHRSNEGEYDNVEKPEGKIEMDVNEAVKGVEFGKVKLGDDIGKKKNKKRKLSKEKELERAKMLQEAKRDPEKGDVIAKKHSWNAAVSRAAGVKVHDDPKLIKQSMHKEKKRHEKNAEKWKERVESREKVKAEKQQKRAGNIAERIQQKKMRKIAKREKKLMRPGFEGRKEGYINEA